MSQSNRPFRAEIQRRQSIHGTTESGGSGTYDEARAEARHKEMMAALADIRARLDQPHDSGEAKSLEEYKREVDAKLIEEYKREVHEAANLKHELEELSEAILNTKKEIAKLHPVDKNSDRIAAMTDELDEIVNATEGATETILSASEVIERHAESIRMHASSDEDMGAIEDISEQIMKIFEACNFQDLTGQRITRVVNTLRFIEERVEHMIQALGGEKELEKVEIDQEVDVSDNRLLHGPQEGAKGISQDQIDALFD